ncbi:unnamed protein product [Symbiodinium sp. CCMP2456]|nr:unnamed protein product [Symbiodinium sp. CCMP2456]
MDSLCRDGDADTRLLGRKTLGGKLQWEQKFRLEALQAEGHAKRQQALGNQAGRPLVQRGWATVQRTAKVRANRSGSSEILGSLEEGSSVFVDAVLGKQALIQQPLRGWVALEKRAGPVFRQEDCQKLRPGEKPALQSVVDDVLMRLCQAPTEAAADMTDDEPRPNFTIAIRSLPSSAWDNIHERFKPEQHTTSHMTRTLEYLPSTACEGSDQVKGGKADARVVASHPMCGLGLAFVVAAAPDCAKPLNLTAMSQGLASSVDRSCLQSTSNPCHRDGASDFRILPGHAWAKIHAAFSEKNIDRGIDADLCMMPGAAWTKLHCNCPKAPRMYPSDGRAGQNLPQGAFSLFGLGFGFVVLAMPSQHTWGLKLVASLRLPPAPQHATSGDFRTLPSASWQKLYAHFPGQSSPSTANSTGRIELGAAPTADNWMPMHFMTLREAVRNAFCCRRRRQSS